MRSARHCRAASSRVLAGIVTFGLVLRLLATVICHSPGLPLTSIAIDDVLGPVVICTSHGLQPLVDDQSPGQAPSALEHCPACALVTVLDLIIALVVTLATLGFGKLPVPIPSSLIRLPDHLRCGSVRSRFPPLPA